MEENGYKLKKIREHLTEPKLISTINTAYEKLNSVACLSDEAIWTTARDSSSREKQSIQFDNECQPLYSENDKIKYITENRNLDICVADSGDRAIIVVTEIGKFRFRYTGHPSTKGKPFKPYGIASDSQSQILTADSDNHCIHILDQGGQFLSFIENCNLKDPYGLCVDKNDDLFVAEFYSGKVKRIQYLT
ncbi:tripartite motif-containing protein 3-like [Saccostrea cucullata]|uniref:tripartite motif-containing protein 3-like n=1 Tax=Saccostrea cuccullata TaxID=36930 RepID=UPI002ED21A60